MLGSAHAPSRQCHSRLAELVACRTRVRVPKPFLTTIPGSHDGVSGDVAPQTIPDQFSLVGVAWAAQYTIVGGGFGDLSQAVSGIVGCP